jgi:LacI family transcriptional regulator
MPVKIEDIAKRVGKSITTVSRALHDYADVSPETKELVRKAAIEMGYTPSTLAQRLQKKRADTIGLILPTYGPRFSDPFFSEFIAGIGNKAANLGYDLLVSTRAPGEQEMQAYHQNAQSRRVDGFVLVRTRRQDPRVHYLLQVSLPFVAFGRTDEALDFPYVDEDSEYGMQLIAEHLAKLGHRNIACINAPEELTFARYRFNGLQKGLINHGIHIPGDQIFQGDLTQNGGYQAASSILDHTKSPTAIVAANDLMAIGAMSAAQERGLDVGKDISITGFDDIPMAEHSHPSLTTIHQPVYLIGSMVCEMLIQLIQGKPLEQRQAILKPTLVVRQSTGKVPN